MKNQNNESGRRPLRPRINNAEHIEVKQSTLDGTHQGLHFCS